LIAFERFYRRIHHYQSGLNGDRQRHKELINGVEITTGLLVREKSLVSSPIPVIAKKSPWFFCPTWKLGNFPRCLLCLSIIEGRATAGDRRKGFARPARMAVNCCKT
jgi:hypothetical protein